jgi:hypothetical protein
MKGAASLLPITIGRSWIRTTMYEQRLCAFVDILGFRKLVERSINRPHLQQQIRNLLRQVIDAKPVWERDSWSVDIIEARLREQGIPKPRSAAEQRVAGYAVAERGTHFSDSIVLSVTLNAHAISSLVTSLIFLSRGAAELGSYVRGGICKGLLCHEEDLCFGPALISAYDLEKKSLYPRIVITPDAHEAIATVDMDVAGLMASYIRTDFDGERFLHFLSPQFINIVGSFLHETQMQGMHHELRRQLSLVRTGDQPRPKLIWLARYFNSVLKEAPISDMESFSIES